MGKKTKIVKIETCYACGGCIAVCPRTAISFNDDDDKAEIDLDKCISCKICENACPLALIDIDKIQGSGRKKEK